MKTQEKNLTRRTTSLLKKGDTVVVIAGGNSKKRATKGKIGKISSIHGERVTIEGVNTVVRFVKSRKPGEKGAPATVEASIHISNVMYYDEKAKKAVRLSTKKLEDGKKVRGYNDKASKKFVQLAEK